MAERAKEHTFIKAQFMMSKQFKPLEKDFLRSILDDGKTYTVDQARKALDKELNRGVK